MTVTVSNYNVGGNVCDTDFQDQPAYFAGDGVIMLLTDSASAYRDNATIQSFGDAILDGIVSDRNDANGWNNYARDQLKARHASDGDVLFRTAANKLYISLTGGATHSGSPDYFGADSHDTPDYAIGGTETFTITLPADIFTDDTEQVASGSYTVIKRAITFSRTTEIVGNETDVSTWFLVMTIADTGAKLQGQSLWDGSSDDVFDAIQTDHAEADGWSGYGRAQAKARHTGSGDVIDVTSSTSVDIIIGELLQSGSWADYDIVYDEVFSVANLTGAVFADGIARSLTGTWTLIPVGGSNPFPSPTGVDNCKLSHMEWCQVWEPGLPSLPGTLGQDDKQQLIWGYSCVAWGGAAARRSRAIITLKDPGRLAPGL